MPADPDDAGPATLRHCPGCERLARALAKERAKFAAYRRLLMSHVVETGNAMQSPTLRALYEEALKDG